MPIGSGGQGVLIAARCAGKPEIVILSVPIEPEPPRAMAVLDHRAAERRFVIELLRLQRETGRSKAGFNSGSRLKENWAQFAKHRLPQKGWTYSLPPNA